MICLIHGYGLSGSGSNLWTRSVAQALAFNGQAFHLVCQEPEPERLDFVAEAYTYGVDGEVEQLFEREVPYEGRCVLHRPQLDLLPVYVQPPKSATHMRAIPDMDEAAIEEYLHRNEVVLHRIVREYGVAAMHVNHVVLMSVVAQRVSSSTGVPYAVMPHGSAIEYVVRKDPRMQKLAAGALSNCARIFVLSDEIRSRLLKVFPEVPSAEARMHPLRIGVNTRQFRLVEREARPDAIADLKAAVADKPRGKAPEATEQLYEGLSDDITRDALQALIEETGQYASKHPDADLEAKLDRVDWPEAEVLSFVGRLIGYKGVHSVIAAFPAILQERPRARLLLTGRGPIREAMEALVWALANGKRRLARNIAAWGGTLEGEDDEPFASVHSFFEEMEAEGKLDEYFAAAERHLRPEHVIFTGYLEHEALCHLYPCCDVTLFPSVVAEGGPMVLVEALASGSFPIGSDHSGIRDNLSLVARNLPDEDTAYMRLRPDPRHTVRDIIEHVPGALALRGKHREALRETAIEHYAWSRIADTLTRELASIAGQA